MPAPTPESLETAEFEALDVETPKRTDRRPGLPLESTRRMKHNTIYHFEAFGVLWGVKLEYISSKKDARTVDGNSIEPIRVSWAAQQPLEGPDGGYQTGTLAQFEKWFKLHGQLSPLEPPMRWRALSACLG
jgi:hypothetical protein